MRALSRRSRRLLSLTSMLFLAGLSATAGEQTARAKAPATHMTQAPLSRAGEKLYAPEEALRDALSSPWRHIGTGRWPGINRMYACAFRNDRVLVVNVYCGRTDVPAVRVDVYSPKRGRVRIYAEASGPISRRTRPQYFTFMAESEPPPGPEAHMPRLALTMSLAELRAYDKQRHGALLPACYGGEEHTRQRGACLGALAPRGPEWAPRGPEWAKQSRAFLERPNDDWYRMVRSMRAVATRYGQDPASTVRSPRN